MRALGSLLGVALPLPLLLLLLLLSGGGEGSMSVDVHGGEVVEDAAETLEDLEGNVARVGVGGNITIQCSGTGDVIYWKKGRHNITGEDERHMIESDIVVVVDDEAEDVVETGGGSGAEPLEVRRVESIMTVVDVTLHDSGRYHCLYAAVAGDAGHRLLGEEVVTLRVYAAPLLLGVSNRSVTVEGGKASVSCTLRAHPPPSVMWLHGKTPLTGDKRFSVITNNESNMHMSKLVLDNATLKDNGTYHCYAENSIAAADRPGSVDIIVHAMLSVEWRVVRSLGPQDLQLEWHVPPTKAKLTSIEVWISDDGTAKNAVLWERLGPEARSLLLDDGLVDIGAGGGRTLMLWLKLNTANNRTLVSDKRNVTMLEKVPEFIPVASFRGSTLDALTVGWTSPPSGSPLREFVAYYLLSLKELTTGATQQHRQDATTDAGQEYQFTGLKPATEYNFSVAGCMRVFEEENRDCGPRSLSVVWHTLYTTPNRVEDVVVKCRHDYSGWAVDVQWIPATEQVTIDHYKLELALTAQFLNERGQHEYENSRRVENVSDNFTSYTFTEVTANTNYTVKVYAGITHMYSRPMSARCSMPVWLPRKYDMQWWKASPRATNGAVTSAEEAELPTLLKLPVPAISQRNGTICCYRVVVVKLAVGALVETLPPPEHLPLLSHHLAHAHEGTAAYVAEVFAAGIKDKYLLLGDNKTVGNWNDGCAACLGSSLVTVYDPSILKPPSSTAFTTTAAEVPGAAAPTPAAESATKATVALLAAVLFPPRRSLGAARRGVRTPETDRHVVTDGQLSRHHNYTGFLVLTVQGAQSQPLNGFSSFFNKVQPIVVPVGATSAAGGSGPRNSGPGGLVDTLILYIGGAILGVMLLVTLTLCGLILFYKRKNKHLEENLVSNESFSDSLGKIFRSLRKSNTMMSQPSIDVKPIVKDDLVSVYLENIKDSELGFRREYEALPEKFLDRTSRASELPENCSKNRYPDIRAYDQTRVKLSTTSATAIASSRGGGGGSTNSSSSACDAHLGYINANGVMGYKERKKFICAQGPMDATVDDFWRMIVEQSCGICVMLTNLEENGKVKCVKYWPEAGQPKTFGTITVRLVKEKSFADYIVRTLRAEWMVPSIVANSDCSNSKGVVGGEGSTSTNTSNASNSNHSSNHSINNSTYWETKYHEVEQYHYLMWRDFVAPEHPVGILAFLRRMNEAYSGDKGPLLVHCSAGVGRTGTLVALDSLVMELDEEQQASVYNLICDLRHQRNFLVQSLKQYVFIHRALMEYAQFGSTEQTPQQLRDAYVKHMMQVQQQVIQPVLNKQFDLLGKVIEERKAFAVATSEENKSKNRSDFVLPYDSNRVILSPISGKACNTYINASFVGGFDLDEHFIVTQDPLESTISDFWRMVYEQDVTTIVMLSEFGGGDDLCQRYWPEEDEEAVHEMLVVKLTSSESYPKYSTRVFLVTNTKNGDTHQVTQFQYIGWSGLLGEVPLGTYGIMEVIIRVQSHIHANLSVSCPAPVLVHCSTGGDRCSVYVCLNNCLRQMRREGRVDVFQITRKIRSQRQFMLQEPSQYEFCYKALIEYVESKGLDNI